MEKYITFTITDIEYNNKPTTNKLCKEPFHNM